MPRGGKRPGAGRPKGASDKIKETMKREAELKEAGKLTPLDFLLGIVQDEEQPQEARTDAAKAAAPYCHPKLAQVEHGGSLNISHEQALDELE